MIWLEFVLMLAGACFVAAAFSAAVVILAWKLMNEED